MTTTHKRDNNVIRSVPVMGSHAGSPAKRPLNALIGGTGGARNLYGQSRQGPVFGAYGDELRQWRAEHGTSQQRYAKTVLPRRRA